MGDQSLIVAANVVVFISAMIVCVGFGVWSWRERETLRDNPLGTLPFSISYLSAWIAAEAAYYGMARPLAAANIINLWEIIPAILVIRLSVAFGAVMHMTPLWRSKGHQGGPLLVRQLGLAFLLAASFTAVTAWLW